MALSRIGSFLKSFITPGIVSSLTTFSATGSTYFGSDQTIKYCGLENNPVADPLRIGLSTLNCARQLTSNVPFIFNHFNEEPVKTPEKPNKKLKLSTRILITALESCGPSSFAYGALGNYLGAVILAGNLLHLWQPNENTEDPKEWGWTAVETLGIACSVCYLCYQWWQRNEKVQKNANRLGENIENGTLHFDKAAIKAAFVVTPNLLSMVVTSYFSTYSGLSTLPFSVPPTVKNILAIHSIISGLVTTLLTEGVAMMDQFNAETQKKYIYIRIPKWVPYAKFTCLSIGSGDTFINTGLYVFISTVFLLSRLMNVSPYHLAVIGTGILLALTKGFQGFTFSVQQNFNRLFHMYMEKHNLVIESEVIQNLLSNEEKQPLRPTPGSSATSSRTSSQSSRTDSQSSWASHRTSGFYGPTSINLEEEDSDDDYDKETPTPRTASNKSLPYS